MEALQSSDTSKPVMSQLLDCSHEVLHNILTFCQPAALGALSRSCRSLHAFILDNAILCKELYLQRFDHPDATADIDWELQLRDLIKLDRLLASGNEEYKVFGTETARARVVVSNSPSAILSHLQQTR